MFSYVGESRQGIVSRTMNTLIVIADEQVGVAHAEETAGDALTRPKPFTDGRQQFPLVVLLGENVFVRPDRPLPARERGR